MITALIFMILTIPTDDDFLKENRFRYYSRVIIVTLCLLLHFLYIYNSFC